MQPAEKPPAPKSRKRKSDAVDGDTAATTTTVTVGRRPAKKKQAAAAKKADDDGLGPFPDLSGVHLDGDEDMSVPVYDTCATVRSKITRALQRDGATKAAFLRALVRAAYPAAASAHKISSNLLSDFMSKKGPVAGNTSSVFYAACVYFEKLRVRDGRPKSITREEMELVWPGGFETRELLDRRSVIVSAGSDVAVNKFGKIVVVGRPMGFFF
ncbi:hypothetical protein LX36DRAFT_660309 [Colletotrichum falcatum]|nr:hypothetical protein LX36DRAFT_660309 [Colletotrichum falcatum]